MKAPCNKCGKRYLGCHAKCEDYADYKAKMEEVNKERQAFRENWIDYHGYKKEKYKRLGGKNE